jgi:hypothetical protein
MLSCAGASGSRDIDEPMRGPLTVGLRSELPEGWIVVDVEVSIGELSLARASAEGEGDLATPAVEPGETRVLAKTTTNADWLEILVRAVVRHGAGQEVEIEAGQRIDLPLRPVAVLVEIVLEDGAPGVEIRTVPLPELEGDGEKCLEVEPEEAPGC